ncbi:acetylcholine receptor subunit beta-like, partial [Saccostrea cucullata]|uniref:acetylcholine receptor subunit beta-like n=1 Tax=Saccostrea cuccullata TaxID=36930 RepID=UPI002ED3E037
MTLYPPTSSLYSNPSTDFLQNYTKNSPPNSTKTVVNISFNAFHLIEFDDMNGKFSVSGYLETSWIDSRIATIWDSSWALETVYFKESEVWTPEIRQMNHNSRFDLEKMVDETVMFYRDGSALMFKTDVFTSYCNTDFFAFPWDTQHCSIDVVAWGFFKGEIILQASESEVNTKFYEQNKDWKLENTKISVDNVDYFGKNGTSKISNAKIEFQIQRHPSYHQFTLVAEHIPRSTATNYTYMGMKVIFDLLMAGFVQFCVVVIHRVYSKGIKVCGVCCVCKVPKIDYEDTNTTSDEDHDHKQNTVDALRVHWGKKLDRYCYR